MIVHIESDVRLYSVLDTVVMSGEYIFGSVLFGTLVGVSTFSGMWFELLMTSTGQVGLGVGSWIANELTWVCLQINSIIFRDLT